MRQGIRKYVQVAFETSSAVDLCDWGQVTKSELAFSFAQRTPFRVPQVGGPRSSGTTPEGLSATHPGGCVQ